MRSIVLISIILFITMSVNAQDIIDSKDYGMGNFQDCTQAALEMLNGAKKKMVSKIRIAPGTYHFYPEKAFEKYCFISNHDDGLRRTPFPVIGFDGLTIEAENVKFIFHGLMVPFIIENSENIHLSGFSIDWEFPLASEALVIARDEENKTFDIKISSEQAYEIRDGELIFLKEGYEHNLDRSIYWDPETGAVAHNTVTYGPASTRSEPSIVRFSDALDYPYETDPKLPVYDFRGKSISVFAKEIEPGIVRISFSGNLVPPKTGLVLVAKGLNGFNRWAPAIRIKNSDNLELTNVSIYSAGGMGVIAESSSNITLDRVHVEPSPGTGRMLSTSADATHFVNCRGNVVLKNSVFANQLDDATNVHGIYLQVKDILASNTLGVRVGHFQQFGFDFGEKGDKIAFVNPDESYDPVFTATLKKIDQRNNRYFIIEFEEDLNLDSTLYYVIENLSAYPDLEISGCKIINNRARGILLSTPGKILVENNYFNTMMSAILIPTELGFWHESGSPKELIIRNNTFGDCCYGGRQNPLINIHTDVKKGSYPFQNIVIENNAFNTFDASILGANNVNGLTFRNNTISRSGNYEPLFPNSPVISIISSRDVILINNMIESDFDNKLHMDDFSKEDAVIKNNEGL
ncbi:right-handed parallel beta-helix repeat-containing protein [Bacteroidota bacterium]